MISVSPENIKSLVVDWIPLGEALVRAKGTKITAGRMKEIDKEGGPIKIFAGGKTVAFVDYDDIPSKDINNEPSIIVKSRGIIEFEFYNQPFSHKSEMWSYHSKNEDVDIKFIYYFLKMNEFYFQNIGSKMQMPQISTPDTDKFLVPIPPKDLQREIVKVLDTFTEIIVELSYELGLRKKQYQCVRDYLFRFEDKEFKWVPLGDIGPIRMCKRVLKKQTLETGEVPFYKIGTFGKQADAYISYELFNEYKAKYNYPKLGEVLISASGTVGRSVIFDGKDSYFQDSNIVWIENDESKVLNKYLFYFYQIAKWNVSDGGVIKRLYNENIRTTEVPIPFPSEPERSLAEQERVVSILDKFHEMTSIDKKGLLTEIDLRKKQYEYYRNSLLSFPKTVGRK